MEIQLPRSHGLSLACSLPLSSLDFSRNTEPSNSQFNSFFSIYLNSLRLLSINFALCLTGLHLELTLPSANRLNPNCPNNRDRVDMMDSRNFRLLESQEEFLPNHFFLPIVDLKNWNKRGEKPLNFHCLFFVI